MKSVTGSCDCEFFVILVIVNACDCECNGGRCRVEKKMRKEKKTTHDVAGERLVLNTPFSTSRSDQY